MPDTRYLVTAVETGNGLAHLAVINCLFCIILTSQSHYRGLGVQSFHSIHCQEERQDALHGKQSDVRAWTKNDVVEAMHGERNNKCR